MNWHSIRIAQIGHAFDLFLVLSFQRNNPWGIVPMAEAQLHANTRHQARQERSRMVLAMQKLEHALASASTTRERRWLDRVRETLLELQTALRETRLSADTAGSLLAELVQEYPRLQRRADRLRADYDALQRHVEDLIQSINGDGADTVRDRLGNLLTRLRIVQARETELIFEAFNVDIGAGD